ncbi:putative protease precursor [Buchnera aphidicola str. Bp (Baizongia pistaciae)]|uniref:tRNA threonylcarbamoyladenosine biosynthesis protein TsaB n=1 Tax=Buchnera aphidicola subsp. Baizongia pistaciae (strain Bp) TaxID=224915 RepID=TSAB_BUCBP|nr:tRNA (adenosine(37)-N6)-threonylcarbamoyltransferase complex dimerization subunit type 1 TsaB [Buchnera aphidicola]Q89AI5.1 RecName: Full=tRNA threonylcarbamoyladenosine biosynthesis protein TsaB; AltName: Full=t(6)A37 threonylcarbamoyladenosine biosynthesis protein TsaB [Buchnera aphidicola str. Bp (Baizongia pistaciae)]AAO27026.1 putative protease precursor [Buchnera aphidicola str. Bp (Baizongia pistaciae)]
MLKTILAFDTSMSVCSISLLHKNRKYNIQKECRNNHTLYLLPMIHEILKKNHVSLNEINIIATSKGPGSFSGVRIALAVAQGISLGLNLPHVISLSTILIMAEQVWNNHKISKVLAIITVNKTSVYWIQYSRNFHGLWIKKSKAIILNLSKALEKILSLKKQWALVGNGWDKFPKNILKKIFITNITFPNSKYIISLISANSIYQKKEVLHKIIPIYLNER